MSAEKFKLVFRMGMSAQVPVLLAGEPGIDMDTRMIRMGNDTPVPAKIPSTDSLGSVEYKQNLTVKFGNITQYEGSTIDGVDISTLGANPGILVKGSSPGEFVHREIENGDSYFRIENGDGVQGNPKIFASENLLNLINNGSGSVKFDYGEQPPVEAPPGSLFWSTEDHLLYIYIADGTDPTKYWWLDITSVGSQRRNGGMTFFSQLDPPSSAAIGDVFHDRREGGYYLRSMDENGQFWVDMRL